MFRINIGALTLVAFIFYVNLACAQLNSNYITDSLKKNVQKSLRTDSLKITKAFNKDQIKKAVDDKISQSKISGFLKKDSLKKSAKIKLQDFSIENSSQFIQTQSQSPSPNFLNNVSVSGQLEIFKFPLSLDLVNNYNPFNNFNMDNNLFKFDFVKPNFSQLYQAKLNNYKRLKSNAFQGLNLDALLKKQIQSRLNTALNGKLSEYPKLQNFLNNPAALKALMDMNEDQIKEKLTSLISESTNTNIKSFSTKELMSMSESQAREKLVSLIDKSKNENVQSISKNELMTMNEAQLKEKLAQFTNEAKNQNSKTIANKGSEIDPLLDDQIINLAADLQSVKQEINESGLDEETISLLQKFAENKITQKELENFFIAQMGKQPKLKGVQNFYSKIREFQAGNFGHKIPGSFTNQDLFLNGVNFSMKTLRGPVSIGIASNKDLDQPKDLGFTSSSFSYPKLFSYISVPTTNFTFGSGKLSWVGVYDKEVRGAGFYSTSVPKNNLVFTITQGVNLPHFGKLSLDVSKSATQYKNLVNGGTDQLFINETTMGNYFRDDFLETMSVGLTHAIDERKLGLNSTIYFNYSGIGFQNPGQQGGGNMNMRFGGNMKKNFFKNKLSIYLKSDFKNTPISAETNAHWRNYNIQLASRIRLSKSYTLNFKYIENGVNKVSDFSAPMYSSKKLQADFNASYKLGGKYSVTHITLGKQAMMSTTLLQNVSSPELSSTQQPNFMMLNYTQTILFKDFSLNGNLFYNKEMASSTLLGNMLNSDIACQYNFFNAVNFSTGITYLNNQNIAKQVGIKQNIQLMLKKHFDVNAYLDLRKNLINPLYPDLFSTTRAEFSIRYYLDRQ